MPGFGMYGARAYRSRIGNDGWLVRHRHRFARRHFTSASAELALIGGDKRHVWIDPNPAGLREDLKIEMNVIRRAFRIIPPGGDLADDFARRDDPAAE